MNILVIFQTIEGQTGKIVKAIERQIVTAGHGVSLFDTEDQLASLSFKDVDQVILAAPVHERRHPENFEVVVSTSLTALLARKTMMISISLNAAFPEGMEEAHDYLIEMKMRTKLNPDKEILVAGAVRADSYDYYESQIVRNVVLSGRGVDLADGEIEYTDWGALQSEVEDFMSAKRGVAVSQ